MPSLHHTPLFHPRLVRERLPTASTPEEAAALAVIAGWLDALRRGDLEDAKEVSLHGEFLVKVFGEVLGYRTMTQAQKGRWELTAEKSVASGQADGALGFFSKAGAHVLAPIELKGAKHFLDHAKGRALTPVQQGWDYANKLPESRWVVVSNYRETRLYAKSKGHGAYELFRLEDLADLAELRRFRALLGRDALLPSAEGAASALDELLLASDRKDREITEALYARYREIRARLFAELRRSHRRVKPAELLRRAQTVLDRVLFVAFAEDRGLLPTDTIAGACTHRDPYHPRPLWENFTAVFRWVDKGNPEMKFSAYNGGLFRADPDLDGLALSDEACGWFKELASYDYRDDVSVDVLGHIFEQSIADLDELRAEAEAADLAALGEAPAAPAPKQRAPSKRRADGIFYTPSFVTSYLVQETLGRAFQERWENAAVGKMLSKKERLAAWEAYRESLRALRVLDPACGSGAFLVAAFDALAQEYERANRAVAELKGGQAGLFDPTRVVLNENLFGVDLNGESVEITRLSLWLKTATRGKPLTYLDRNVRWGNSVVSDASLDPRAFNWKKGRPARASLEDDRDDGDVRAIEERWRDGFDVVIGNPPYVRQELLTRFKDHWRESFEAFHGAADLFVYFFERSLQQLRPGGRLGFIVSNKWLRGTYAEALRGMLARDTTVESMVDFGHAPVFPDADAFPCIVTLRKAAPPEGHVVAVTQFPREQLERVTVPEYVATHRRSVPQARFGRAGWSLESGAADALMRKIREGHAPLTEYAKVKPYYGVKTGCNEAFLIDTPTKERLCKEDPGSAALMKRYLRGQDIARWAPEWAGLWIIVMKSSADQGWPWAAMGESAAERSFRDRFPAVHAFMKPHEAALRKRTDRGRFWWELRSCAYYERFAEPRIIYQEIQFHPAYALDREGYYLNNKGFFVPTDDAWLLAVLNSPLMWWHNWRYLQHMKDEALSPAADKLVSLPIAAPTANQREAVAAMTATLVANAAANAEGVAGLLDALRMQYEVESPGQKLGDFAALDGDGFVAEVLKRRASKAPLKPSQLKALRALFGEEAAPIQARRATARELEVKLAREVHAAYGLTASDEALLWETAPPRMPFIPQAVAGRTSGPTK